MMLTVRTAMMRAAEMANQTQSSLWRARVPGGR
jgi:hypothetical protein